MLPTPESLDDLAQNDRSSPLAAKLNTLQYG